MRTLRRLLAGATLGIVLSGAWFMGQSLVRNVQFARAEQDIQATRAQISNVQDMAAVFKAVNKVVEPAVVKIDVTKTMANTSVGPRGNLRRFFPPDDNGDMPQIPQFDIPSLPTPQLKGTGSGVIVESDGKIGYIVTNNHVASDADKMTVTLSDGREIKIATVVGTDPKSDLAVVKIEADHLVTAKWGDSETLEKGDIILAFGAPFGYVGSMTHGIVSALDRHPGIIDSKYSQENFIQVDAPINPGNSGGPLVDLHGNVVGINTAIATENGGFMGLGFAIPSNQAKFIYEQIKNKGKVARGWLGVGIKDVTIDPDEIASLGYTGTGGALVKEVYRDTPAYGKLKSDDIVTSINGKNIASSQELRSTVAGSAPGTEIEMKVFRDRKTENVKIKLGEQPSDENALSAATGNNNRRNDNNQTTANTVGLRISAADHDVLQSYGMDDSVHGVIVTNVRPGSLAQRAMLRAGDVITRVNSTATTSVDEFNDALSKADLKKGVMFHVTNKESERSIFVKADE
ncbi:MAG TPA: trypsin-like peptidase domain-containing protein [Tepidisphaeraceae bacterium]|nr:trypsin-like peptidase domain-containing protein [Tepidisphaeraceae bacterium]